MKFNSGFCCIKLNMRLVLFWHTLHSIYLELELIFTFCHNKVNINIKYIYGIIHELIYLLPSCFLLLTDDDAGLLFCCWFQIYYFSLYSMNSYHILNETFNSVLFGKRDFKHFIRFSYIQIMLL